MYKVSKIEIDGFWHRLSAECEFHEDVNVIIGRNGTGKTTFMNILNSVLTVDLPELLENDFEVAKIYLADGKKKKTIKVTKIEGEEYPFPFIEYQISQRKKKLRLFSADDPRYSPRMLRRRLSEQAVETRELLDEIVSVSALSVYRLRSDDDYEVRDRHGSKIISPVDYRLAQALRGLTQFQLELAQEAKRVSERLQRDVLASILYGEEDEHEAGWNIDFDKVEEQSRLNTAYAQLNSSDPNIRKKIRYHVNAIDKVIGEINNQKVGVKNNVDIKPLEALRKTRKIIDLSLKAKQETQDIDAPIELFLKTLEEFISDKKFSFESGSFSISNEHEPLEYTRLSSGEKQLIILMVEALLQKQEAHVFLADEPELSLHIAWQRKIIPAIRRLNPNGQVIVATHSPEVAAKYKDAIFDMEQLLYE